MKKIMILNGSGRKNGNTSGLVKAFMGGAIVAGNEVREFYLQSMNIHGCMNCLSCARAQADENCPCCQKDDMTKIYEAFLWCDVVVLASPLYWFTITGTLKTAVDRLYAIYKKHGNIKKSMALLMTAGVPAYEHTLDWYNHFERVLGWKNLGTVLSKGLEEEKLEEARRLGASIT